MVQNGHLPIRQVRFHNPRLAGLGLDLLTLANLRRKATPERLARPERLDFHMLFHCTAGAGNHEIDFERYPVRPGTVLWVRPRQVQQYRITPAMRGRLLLIDPGCVPVSARGPAWWELPTGRHAEFRRDLDRIEAELAAYRGDALSTRLLHHLAGALLAGLERQAGQGGSGTENKACRLLKDELARCDAPPRSVGYYARRLGYSQKTLTRACLAAEGRSAKAVIDASIVLEARRRLAHSGSSAAAIGAELGFTEATNFAKFFRRAAGLTPGAFRKSLTGRVG